jgi:hypothetical protein
MRTAFIHALAIAGIAGLLSISATASLAKTVSECNADYAANKDAVKASGQTKKDYVAACRAGTATAPAAAPAATTAPTTAASGKSAKDCETEYSTNKAAIKAGGQKKKDFVTACRAGTEVIPTAPAASAPAPVPTPTVAPAPVPQAAPTLAPVAPKPAAKAPTPAGSGNDAQVRASCPSDTVVWVNTKSGVYHFAGTHNYGTTKQGAYMCEAAAKAAGDRAAENEKHP